MIAHEIDAEHHHDRSDETDREKPDQRRNAMLAQEITPIPSGAAFGGRTVEARNHWSDRIQHGDSGFTHFNYATATDAREGPSPQSATWVTLEVPARPAR